MLSELVNECSEKSKAPGEGMTARVCPATGLFCPLPSSAFLESSPSWKSDRGSKKGKLPSLLMPDPLPFKFWARDCLLLFPWCFKSPGVSFFYFPLRLLFKVSVTFPRLNLKLALGVKSCYFTHGQQTLEGPDLL